MPGLPRTTKAGLRNEPNRKKVRYPPGSYRTELLKTILSGVVRCLTEYISYRNNFVDLLAAKNHGLLNRI